jgi:pyruvate-formate lyase-activating enzyme
VYKLEAGIRFLTETYGKCLSPLERRERGQKEKVTQFTLILRSVVLVFRCRVMCSVCQNKEISRINNAAWKKYEEMKKDVNKGRKVKRTRCGK